MDDEGVVLDADINVFFVDARTSIFSVMLCSSSYMSTGGAKLVVVNASSGPSGLYDSRNRQFMRLAL